MGLRFRKSIKICKGVSLNLGSKGASVSLGTKGARYTVGTSGRRTATVGIPGTGLSYSKTFSSGKKTKKSSSETVSAKKGSTKIQDKTQAVSTSVQEQLDEQTSYLDRIRKIHTLCSDQVDWNAEAQALPPFTYGTQGPLQTQAVRDYENYKPTLSERLMSSKLEKHKKELFDTIQSAASQDAEQYNEWNEHRLFAERILKGDTDAYLSAIEENNPFEDFADYGSDFEFGTEDSHRIEVEFAVQSEGVVPARLKGLTPTGKLSEKNITKTQFYDYTQDYVCSTAIRLAREMFALLPVDTVLVHAVDKILNTATGNDEELPILSVEFQRDRFTGTNFDRIDCSDFVTSFRHNMSFSKTTGFRETEELN